ncbi:MAG: hypothetical protein DRQ89_09160 [Epsilonproteobacteria bacterium]|nr:MAG: hypothetical protein DRQ89_09160 [Campylobacterota bacterium]
MYDLTVIGDGIAANLFLIEYLKKSPQKVLQIHAEDKALPCTQNTTGTIFLKGVEMGRSPLGDLIYRSYHEAASFFKQHNPPGINSATLFYVCDGKKDTKAEFIRRFETVEPIDNFAPTPHRPSKQEWGKTWDGFVLNSTPFREYLDKTKRDLGQGNLEIKEDLLVGVQNGSDHISLKLLNGEVITTKKLVLCTGAYTKLYQKIYPEIPVIANSKIIPGSYLETENVDLGESTFVLARSGHNLIYHSEYKRLIIGATHQLGELQAPDYANLQAAHQNFSDLLDVQLPPISTFSVKSGLRHRGVKKLPFWGRVEGEIYGIFSLYRNGLTFPFLAARELSDSIL